MEIKELTEFDGFIGDVYTIDQFRNTIVTGGHDKKVYIWHADINNKETFGRLKCELIGHEHSIKSLTHAEHNNDIIIISGSWDSTIRLWSYNNMELLNVLKGHSNRIRQVGICYIGNAITIMSTGDDRSLRLWDMVTGIPLRTYEKHHNDTIHCFCLYQKFNDNSLNSSNIDTFIATGGADKLIKYFYLNEHQNDSAQLLQSEEQEGEGKTNRMETLSGHKGRIMCLKSWYDPLKHSSMLASCATDEMIKIWSMENGICVFTIQNLCPVTSLGILSHPSTAVVSSIQVVGAASSSSISSSFSSIKRGSVADAAAAAPITSSPSGLSIDMDINLEPNEVMIPTLWTADTHGHIRIFDTCTGEPLSLASPTRTENSNSNSNNRRRIEKQSSFSNNNNMASNGGVVTGTAISLVSEEQALHGLDIKWMNTDNNNSNHYSNSNSNSSNINDLVPLRLVSCGSQSVKLYNVSMPLLFLKRKRNKVVEKNDKNRRNPSRNGKRIHNNRNRNFGSIGDRDFNRLQSRNQSRKQSHRGKRQVNNNNFNNRNDDDQDTQSLGVNFKSPQRFQGVLDSGVEVDFTLPGIGSPTDNVKAASKSSKRAIYDATPDDDDFSVMSLEVGTKAYDPNSLLQPFEGGATQRRTRFGGRIEANLNRRRELNKQRSVLIDARNNDHFLNMQPNLPIATEFKQQMSYLTPHPNGSSNGSVGGNSVKSITRNIGFRNRNSNRSVNYTNNGMRNSNSHGMIRGNTATRTHRNSGGIDQGHNGRQQILLARSPQYQQNKQPNQRILSISQWNKKLSQQ